MTGNTFTMTINGAAAGAAKSFAAINPADGSHIADVPDADRSQLDLAVSSARAAQAAWAATPLAQRAAALQQVAAVLMANQGVLAELLTTEQGKPLESANIEIATAAHWCAETAKLPLPVTTIEDSETRLVQTRHVPLGVVGAIVPWNFPVVLAFWKIAPALLAGNTMVLKPSPFTSLTTLKIGELLRPIFPAGVLNVITGGDDLGPWLTAHPGIDKISFTGSTATGRRVMASAAANLKRLTLELGGNDAAIVMPDVDIAAVAPQLFWGSFANSSQFCLAIKRLYVHEAIYEPMKQALLEVANSVKMGPGLEEGTQLGPVQNRVQFDRLRRLLDDSIANGHKFVVGGKLDTNQSGLFFPVTIVDNPPEDSRIVQEEPFGPMLPLLKFSDVDDVIARANASEYGLGGSVWCSDLTLARQIADRLQTGTVWVNEIHTLGPNKPMAGHKQSGLGVENALEGLLEYTALQTLSMKK